MPPLRAIATTALATLLTVEVAARLLLGAPDRVRQVGNDTPTGRRLIAQLQTDRFGDDLQAAMGGRLAWHPRWGWANRPGVHTRTGVTTTLDEAGHRVTGAAPGGPRVVLLGDSFTYGDEVDDADTWAWRLAARTGADVINAGVLGHGLDQILLHAQDELPALQPDLVVVSVNALEILREGLGWDAWKKPVFALDDGRLIAPGPVPAPDVAATERRALRTLDVVQIWIERQTGPIQRPETLAPLTWALLDALEGTAPRVLFVWQTLPEELPPIGDRPRSALWPQWSAWAARGHDTLDSTALMGGLTGTPIARGAHWTPEVHEALAAWLAPEVTRRVSPP